MAEPISEPASIVVAASAIIIAIISILTYVEKKYPMAFTMFARDPYRVLELRLVRNQIDLDTYKKFKKILDDNRKKDEK